MNSDSNIEPVNVFTGSLFDAEMIRNILENEGIESFLNDQYIGTIAPWYISPATDGSSVSVIVSSPDADKAKLIVEEYRKEV
jgi:hypothetical protein